MRKRLQLLMDVLVICIPDLLAFYSFTGENTDAVHDPLFVFDSLNAHFCFA